MVRPVSKILAKSPDVHIQYPNARLAIDNGVEEHVVRDFLWYIWIYERKAQVLSEIETPIAINRVKRFASDFTLPNDVLVRQDVSGARLRATYWDTRAAIFQPCVDYVLGDSTAEPDEEMVRCAGEGIAALANSLDAFCGLPKQRPIMPNTTGIAYA
jgi:hypothetical protein